MTAPHDVLGVGNAIVDILAQTDDAFLAEQGMAKGGMALVDEERAHAIYAAMGSAVEASGGSAANTIAGVASFGGRAAFLGKVRDDEFGRIFAHDLKALGVTYCTPPSTGGAATARCLVLVTPDAQRTMNTHLGACVDLGPDDIDPALVASARITYLEGYLFDPPHARDAFRKAAGIARGAGRKVALSLSDSFCVHRYRDEFMALIRDHVDVLFANEAEVEALLPGLSLAEAADELAAHAGIAAITLGARGRCWCRVQAAWKCPLHRSTAWSIPLARATFMPQACCSACAATCPSHGAARWAPSLRPK
ncbi:MAG: hypothetical protein RIS94_639 [Pseudomonadota bacterium]